MDGRVVKGKGAPVLN